MLYIHIPFCKKACHYCDFHFSTSLQLRDKMVEAICKEMLMQQNYLGNIPLQSIYFGGGTPSLLTATELAQIFDTIYNTFEVSKGAEITLEANPDDLSKEKLQTLKNIGVNRLSIGIQSFNDTFLVQMNRSHHAKQALAVVQWAKEVGFDNFSIDLMYGFPATDHSTWQQDILQALMLKPKHISCYCLTVEPQTALDKQVKTKQFVPVSDHFAAQQYEMLMEILEKAGYIHYEISNFALPDFFARHNSNYWKKGSYLGIGASAHSYNGVLRQANVANNVQYIRAIANGILPATIEQLSNANHINEYILVNLRTIWGCSRLFLREQYQYEFSEKLLLGYAQQHLVRYDENYVFLTKQGRLLADKICSDFFVEAS
jgi:oxygen-independent coproporphyrinogen III oxidase